jgi:hypothetical protein
MIGEEKLEWELSTPVNRFAIESWEVIDSAGFQ